MIVLCAFGMGCLHLGDKVKWKNFSGAFGVKNESNRTIMVDHIYGFVDDPGCGILPPQIMSQAYLHPMPMAEKATIIWRYEDEKTTHSAMINLRHMAKVDLTFMELWFIFEDHYTWTIEWRHDPLSY